MARYNLEGEKPTSFFCNMNKNVKNTAQFDTMIIREKDDNGDEQKSIEWEVKKFYWKLHRK